MVGSEWSPFPDEKDEESQEGRTQGHLVILRQRTRVLYPDAGFSGGGHSCCLPLHLAWGRCLLGQSQRWQGVSSSGAWKEGSSLPSPRPPTPRSAGSLLLPPQRGRVQVLIPPCQGVSLSLVGSQLPHPCHGESRHCSASLLWPGMGQVRPMPLKTPLPECSQDTP